jgi:hypothetical protein
MIEEARSGRMVGSRRMNCWPAELFKTATYPWFSR